MVLFSVIALFLACRWVPSFWTVLLEAAMLEMKGPVYESQGLDFSPNSASSCVTSDESFNLSDLKFLIQELDIRLHNFPKPP